MALSDAEHKANDETIKRLKDLKKELEAKVWPAAIEAGAEYSEDSITRLVELKARLDALDLAIKSGPSRPGRVVRSANF